MPDDARRFLRVRLNVAAREPVELERAAPAVVSERPVDPPEAPARNPLAHVRVRRQVFHVVMKSARALLVQLSEREAAPLDLAEQSALEPAFGFQIVVLDDVADSHQHAAREAEYGVDGAARIVS